MTLYNKLKKNYNDYTNNKIKIHRNINRSTTKLKTSVKFLLQCRKSGIMPKFINNSTKNILNIFKENGKIAPKIQQKVEKNIHILQTKILNILIQHKHDVLKENKTKLTNIKRTIHKLLKEEDAALLFNSEDKINQCLETRITTTQINKITKLKEKQREVLNINNTNNWFVNKTETNIPIEAQWLLSLGPKFALPITRNDFPLFKCIADGEMCIQTIKDREEQDVARTKFTTLIERHLNTMNINGRDKAILKTVEQTRKFLIQNKNIIITNSDKGNVTVAMEKTDYDNKMNTMLRDKSTYKILKRDPTSKYQQKNNEIVEKLHKDEVITLKEKYNLINRSALAPRIYGLPKIHKDDMPLRPICSSINSPSYSLCKYVVNILNNLTKESRYNVKDAIGFKERVNNTYICDDEIMISLDVISLFPSIPVDFAIKIIESKWEIIQNFTNMTKRSFLDIIKFCIIDNRYFTYAGKMYAQQKGMPMGSPASPVIADIIMEELLDKSIQKLTNKPRCVTKYVDDLFAIVQQSAINEIMDVFNSYHCDIKFTIELEKDNRLPYLDTVIVKYNNIIKLDWYQKPMASGRLINFFSNHPKQIIINTASNFIRRVLNISDNVFHKDNKRRISAILHKNNFPSPVILNLINNQSKHTVPEKNTKELIFKSMPYIPSFSERFKNSNILDKEKYCLALKTNNTLKSLFTNTKSKVNMEDKSNIIYQITCSGNEQTTCNKIYVGTTKSKLKTRISGHKTDQKTRTNTSQQRTALATHCTQHSHTPDFDNVKILQQENNYTKRFLLEMLHITKTPTEKRINYKTDTDGCAHIYRHLITRKAQISRR